MVRDRALTERLARGTTGDLVGVVRVLESTRDSAVVADPFGVVSLVGGVSAPVGALVELVVRRTPDGLRAVECRTLAAPSAGLAADGDVRRVLRDAHGRRLAARADALRAVRAFFDARGSLEVETPTVVTNPGMDVHLDAFALADVRGPRYLSTSPEYAMKRLLASGFTRLHQLVRSYRRDEAGALHQPEFTLLEWYEVGATAAAMRAETEALVTHVARTVHGSSRVEVDGTPLELEGPWPVTTVYDAVRLHTRHDPSALSPDELLEVLGLEVQPALGRGRPEWLVDWPIELASLARPCPHDPGVAERFEAYACGIELCNGFAELTDPVEQRRRFASDAATRRTLGKPVPPMDEHFLTALEDGMPDAAGNALGFDRLLMVVTGATRIDQVVAIPHTRA